MKKYEYVGVDYTGMVAREIAEYKEIIDSYAQKGYRYVGFIPTKIAGNAQLAKIDLIFESDC